MRSEGEGEDERERGKEIGIQGGLAQRSARRSRWVEGFDAIGRASGLV